MVPDHRARLDVPTDSLGGEPQDADAKPTLYKLVIALSLQQEEHTQALARIGNRLSDAEECINILLQEVGQEPMSGYKAGQV